jgi:hypothetical protein
MWHSKVFGVLVWNSLAPTNNLNIDILGPPTSWLSRNVEAQNTCSKRQKDQTQD